MAEHDYAIALGDELIDAVFDHLPIAMEAREIVA